MVGCELAGHSQSLDFLCRAKDPKNDEFLYRQDKSDDGNRGKRKPLSSSSSSSSDNQTIDLSRFHEPNLFLYCGGCAYVPPYLWDMFLMKCAKDIQTCHEEHKNQQSIVVDTVEGKPIPYYPK